MSGITINLYFIKIYLIYIKYYCHVHVDYVGTLEQDALKKVELLEEYTIQCDNRDNYFEQNEIYLFG